MGCHFLPQGIFPNQGLKLCFPHAPALAGRFFTAPAISPFLKLKLANGSCILLCFSNNLLLDLLCLVTQSCPTLCNHMDCSPPGSSVNGILQARILECMAMPSSRESSQPRDQTLVSRIAGRFFTVWASKEALGSISSTLHCFPNHYFIILSLLISFSFLLAYFPSFPFWMLNSLYWCFYFYCNQGVLKLQVFP